MYRDSEQSHDDANYRPAVLPTKVCPSEDETARCKYSGPSVSLESLFMLPNWWYYLRQPVWFQMRYSVCFHFNFTWILACILFWPVLIFRLLMQRKDTLFSGHRIPNQSCQMLRSAPWSTTCPHISPAWYIIDLHVQMISNNRTNNHSHCTIMGLSWLETMKVNMLAGGEDTAAPLTLFQDHPRLSSRSPHAASTQRKTFNWVINYTTNKTPSWFLPPLVFLLLFEAAFRFLVVAWW